MNRRALIFVELFLLGIGMACRSFAQQLLPTGGQHVLQPTDEQVRPTPDDTPTDVYANPELPNDQIMRDPGGQPYSTMFYAAGSPGRLEPKVGGVRLDLPENIFRPSLSYKVPFTQASGAQTNAEIRVGRLYYDVTSLSGSLLYSDNVDLTQTGTRAGLIGIVELKGIVYVQLMENLRIAAKVGVVWFPFRNKVGVDGFTQDSVYGRVLLGDSEKFRTQLTYDIHPGDWDIIFYDQYRATQALFADRYSLAATESFDETDRTGRYLFRNTTGGAGSSPVRVNEADKRYSNAFIYGNNQVGATASRLLPTETRVTFGFYRLDYQYLGGDTTFLPRSREVGFVSFNNEHDAMRFKPFANYQIYHYEDKPWDQEVRAGVRGPITENISFLGSVGWFFGQRDRFLADAVLRHDIGPYTSQTLEYRRDITAPVQDLEERYSYSLRQVLGPYLTVNPFVRYSTYEDLSNNGSGTRELRAGMFFTSDVSGKTTLRFGPIYSRIVYTTSPLVLERWLFAAQISHFFTESFEARLTYQFQDRKSTQAGDSYEDDLVMLTLTKYFNAPQHKVAVTDE